MEEKDVDVHNEIKKIYKKIKFIELIIILLIVSLIIESSFNIVKHIL